MAPLSAKKSKGPPGSTGKQSFTQQSVRVLWSNPERCREDEAFEQTRDCGTTSILVVILDDETAEAILVQQQAACPSHTCPVMTFSTPTPTATSTRPTSSGAIGSGAPKSGAPRSSVPSSGALHSHAPVPREQSRKASPTGPWPSTVTVPMPAPIQLPSGCRRDQDAPPDLENVIVVRDDDELLSGTDRPRAGDKSKGNAKKARTYTAAEEAARQELRDGMQRDCRQLQYEKEFESFKEYRKMIKSLRTSPNTMTIQPISVTMS